MDSHQRRGQPERAYSVDQLTAAQWLGDSLLALVTCLRRMRSADPDETVKVLIREGRPKRSHVLYYAFVFLIVAIMAELLGLGAIAFAAAGIAKVLFFAFLIPFLIGLDQHMSTRV